MQPKRIQNLRQLRALGQRPYECDCPPAPYFKSVYVPGVADSFAGRILTIRRMGKMCFLTVAYSENPDSVQLSKIQVVLQEGLTRDGWKEAAKSLDIGDIVYFHGTYKTTISGENSLFAHEFILLTKALVTVPFGQEKDGDTFNKIEDPAKLIRNRHVAMLVDGDLRESLVRRSRMIQNIREALFQQSFIEAQTPVLLAIPGGADAKTFDTYYNAYNTQVKLRISLEIQLKKLLCGGFDRVYEIGTVFRNEGVSAQHNPEFTLLEYYTAYDSFDSGIERFKNIVEQASCAFDSTISVNDWETMTMAEAILRYANVDIEEWDHHDPMYPEMIESTMKIVEPHLILPTILTQFPACMSPLARNCGNKYAERFEAYIQGMEIANGFCEQNDPQEQLKALEAQSGETDYDFIYALSCGMPPAFGVGIGIDRLALVLSGEDHIRQVNWFPYVKPVSHQNTEV